MLTITMPRGDLRLVRFQIYDAQTGEISQVDFTEIYMTAKKNIYEKDALFQKKLSTGGIEKLDVGDYQLRINPEDTDQLEFGKKYPFDIELIAEGQVKQTEMGEIILTPEITCSWNEVE